MPVSAWADPVILRACDAADRCYRARYHYSAPVFLEPMILRLRPRSDAVQTVRSHSILITPNPSGISHYTELDGNNTEVIWFNEKHDELLIHVSTRVETHYGDAFNFLVTDPGALKLPLRYEPQLALALTHYLLSESDPKAASFAQEVMQTANQETLSFLIQLAAAIPNRLEYSLREHGYPWTEGETLQNGQGSCRDFAVLFIEVCRIAGIAARFVSGYCFGDEAATSHMHAWAEVYLPGAGWRGFDPSRGLATSDEYISVAASARSQEAAPTDGSFRGQAGSSLQAQIQIRALKIE